MNDILPSCVAIVIGLGFVGLALRGDFTRKEKALLWLAFWAHVIAAVAQVWITLGVYGGGDMFGYHRQGMELARLVRYDPGRFLPQVFGLIFHQEVMLPIKVYGIANTTGSMAGFAGVLCLIFNDSIYASGTALGIFAYFGQLALFRTTRDLFEPYVHTRLLMATMLVPSVVYWTSTLFKESIAFAGLGWAVYGIHIWLRGDPVRGVVLLALGATGIALLKPYILMPLAIAGSVWWFWLRSQTVSKKVTVVVKPMYFVLGAAVAFAAVAVVGEMFPRYSLDTISDETAELQNLGTRIRGGSNYALAPGANLGMVGQLAYAPLALVTALFRPLFFEARSVTALLNSMETTTVTVLAIHTFVKQSWRDVWKRISESPFLMFSLVFSVSFGVAVGLASTNFGSLSRYRIPLMPFFVGLVLVCNSRRNEATALVAPTRGEVIPLSARSSRPSAMARRRA